MMRGVLATYGNIAIVLVEVPVCRKFTGCLDICYFKLTGILAHLCNRECIVVRPLA